jgi:hypothetical protein
VSAVTKEFSSRVLNFKFITDNRVTGVAAPELAEKVVVAHTAEGQRAGSRR